MAKQHRSTRSLNGKFSRAVENVHVSLGHTLLGTSESSLLWRLAAGPPPSSEQVCDDMTLTYNDVKTEHYKEVSAFHLELNSLLEQFTSKDFKKFRYEVLERCSSKALFKLNETFIAEKLIHCLLDRSGGSFSSKAMQKQIHSSTRKNNKHDLDDNSDDNNDNDSDNSNEVNETTEEEKVNMLSSYDQTNNLTSINKQRKSDNHSNENSAVATNAHVDESHKRGEVSESFEAFAKLTIAFARDVGWSFVHKYYDVFHTALNAGMYDKNGQFINNVNRLQFIFHVQCGWIREMSPYLTFLLQREAQCKQKRALQLSELHSVHNDKEDISHVINLILKQWNDSKNYVRRLAAELLAYLCRLHITLLPFIMEHINVMLCHNYVNDNQHIVENEQEQSTKQHLVDAIKVNNKCEETEEPMTGEEEEKEEEDHINETKNIYNEEIMEFRHTSKLWTSYLVREYCTQLRLFGKGDNLQKEHEVQMNEHIGEVDDTNIETKRLVECKVTASLQSVQFVETVSIFTSELMRGVRGSLNSHMERNYAIMLHGMMLTERLPLTTSSFSTDNTPAKEHTHEKQSTDAIYDSNNNDSSVNYYDTMYNESIQFPDWHVFSCKQTSCSFVAISSHKSIGASDIHHANKSSLCNAEHHQILIDAKDNIANGASNTQANLNTLNVQLNGACELIQRVGGIILGSALSTVLIEIIRTQHRESNSINKSNNYYNENSDEEDEEDETKQNVKKRSMHFAQNKRVIDRNSNLETLVERTPSHRLLEIVVHYFTEIAKKEEQEECDEAVNSNTNFCITTNIKRVVYIRILSAVLSCMQCTLWCDRHSNEYLITIQHTLHKIVENMKLKTRFTWCNAIWEVYAAVLEFCVPLCTYFQSPLESHHSTQSISTSTIFADRGITNMSYESQLQRQFLPIAKCVVQQLVAQFTYVEMTNNNNYNELQNMYTSFQMLYCFVQDVLQKSYALSCAANSHNANQSFSFDVKQPEKHKQHIYQHSHNKHDATLHREKFEEEQELQWNYQNSLNKRTRMEKHKSFLTPFALTLLHLVIVPVLKHVISIIVHLEECESFKIITEHQKEQLQEERNNKLIGQGECNNKNTEITKQVDNENTTHDTQTFLPLWEQIVHDTLVLLTLAHTKPHEGEYNHGIEVSPLQQLMRLSAKSKQANKKTSAITTAMSGNAEVTVVSLHTNKEHHGEEWQKEAQFSDNSNHTQEMEELNFSSAGEELQVALFAFLEKIISLCCSTYRSSSSNDDDSVMKTVNNTTKHAHETMPSLFVSRKYSKQLTLTLPLFYALPRSLLALWNTEHAKVVAHNKRELVAKLITLMNWQDEDSSSDVISSDKARNTSTIKKGQQFESSVMNTKNFAMYVQIAALLHYLTFYRVRGKQKKETQKQDSQYKGKIGSFSYLLDAVRYLIDGFSHVKQMQDKSIHSIIDLCSEACENEGNYGNNINVMCEEKKCELLCNPVLEQQLTKLYNSASLLFNSLELVLKTAGANMKENEYHRGSVRDFITQLQASKMLNLFVEVVLLQCIASPSHKLRTQALRILSLFVTLIKNSNNKLEKQENTEHEERKKEYNAIEADVINNGDYEQSSYTVHVNLLRSLHGAFMYNPLATTVSSDVDIYDKNEHFLHHGGNNSNNTKTLESALASVLFDVEAGKYSNNNKNYKNSQFETLLLTYAMIGLLHLPYKPAWEIATKILVGLVRHDLTNSEIEQLNEVDNETTLTSLLHLPPHEEEYQKTNKLSTIKTNNQNAKEDKEGKYKSTVVCNTFDSSYRIILRCAGLLTFRGAKLHFINTESSSSSSTEPFPLCNSTVFNTTNTVIPHEVNNSCRFDNNYDNEKLANIVEIRQASQGWYQFYVSDAQRYAASAIERDFTTREITHNSSKNNYKYLANEQNVHIVMLTCVHVPIRSNYNDAPVSNLEYEEREECEEEELEERVTDSSTVAVYFVGIFTEILRSLTNVHSLKAMQLVQIVQSLFLEMSAMHRKEHPLQLLEGNSRTTCATEGELTKNTHNYSINENINKTSIVRFAQISIKKLDDRLLKIMEACAAAPFVNGKEMAKDNNWKHSNDAIRNVCESFLFDGANGNAMNSSRLQRASLDNLKRMKVFPYSKYYTQLTPFCESNKTLFAFLNTFHIETEIPIVEDKVEYLSVALLMILPRLMSKTQGHGAGNSRNKNAIKEYNLLKRRMMSYIMMLSQTQQTLHPFVEEEQEQEEENSTSTEALTSTGKLKKPIGKPIRNALAMLMDRLVFDRFRVHHDDLHNGHTTAAMFDFRQQWRALLHEEYVEHSHVNVYRCVRFVEKLVKQLVIALPLLDTLMKSTTLSSFSESGCVSQILMLCMNSYVMCCKHLLKESIDQVVQSKINQCENVNSMEDDNNTGIDVSTTRHAADQLLRELSKSALSNSLSSIRRHAINLVCSVFEQFPQSVITCIHNSSETDHDDHEQECHYHKGKVTCGTNIKQQPILPLLSLYLEALQFNTKGMMHTFSSDNTSVHEVTKTFGKRKLQNSMMRMILSWISHEELLCLLPRFDSVVINTLDDIFISATSDTDASLHSSSLSQDDVFTALQAINDILTSSNVSITLLPTQNDDWSSTNKNNDSTTSKIKRTKHESNAKRAFREDNSNSVVKLNSVTLQSAFIAPHIDHLFSLLFQYIQNGTLVQETTRSSNDINECKRDERTLYKNQKNIMANTESNTHDNIRSIEDENNDKDQEMENNEIETFDVDENSDGGDDQKEETSPFANDKDKDHGNIHNATELEQSLPQLSRSTSLLHKLQKENRKKVVVAYSVFKFSVPMWKELIRTVKLIVSHLSLLTHHEYKDNSRNGKKVNSERSLTSESMIGTLLEIVLKFTIHPICSTELHSLINTLSLAFDLTKLLTSVSFTLHFTPLARLYNSVTSPQARLLLCEIVNRIAHKVSFDLFDEHLTINVNSANTNNNYVPEERHKEEYDEDGAANTTSDMCTSNKQQELQCIHLLYVCIPQLQCAASIAKALNAFERLHTTTSNKAINNNNKEYNDIGNMELEMPDKDSDSKSESDNEEGSALDNLHPVYNEVNLSKYDFVRRYHVFHHLISFFVNDGVVPSERTSTRSKLQKLNTRNTKVMNTAHKTSPTPEPKRKNSSSHRKTEVSVVSSSNTNNTYIDNQESESDLEGETIREIINSDDVIDFAALTCGSNNKKYKKIKEKPKNGKDHVNDDDKRYYNSTNSSSSYSKTEQGNACNMPVMCIAAFRVLVTNVMFFLRDREGTIRSLAYQLLQAMLRYASRQDAKWEHYRLQQVMKNYSNTNSTSSNEEKGTVLSWFVDMQDKSFTYSELVLEEVIRSDILPSLRRGVNAKDTLIRHVHMAGFDGLAKYFSIYFPSLAPLHSANGEVNFYANINHVHHRNRLHALSQLREFAEQIAPRELLRVFIPFLMNGLKDYAQGKYGNQNNNNNESNNKNLMNLNEARAKGYADALLLTICSIARQLPWQGYHYLLQCFLQNAQESISMRLLMMKGMVQLLQHFHFFDDNDDNSEKEKEAHEMKKKTNQRTRILHTLEVEILPQLFAYIVDKKESKNFMSSINKSDNNTSTSTALASIVQRSSTTTNSNSAELKSVHINTIEHVRREQAKDEHQTNTALQLPVVLAIIRLLVQFPEHQRDKYMDYLLDHVVIKLRTRQDKHREKARRMLSAIVMVCGPAKLHRVVTKLRDHLIHGYQLHVLGYTVVTLLYQMYEPHSRLIQDDRVVISGGSNNSTKSSMTIIHKYVKEERQTHVSKNKDIDNNSEDEVEMQNNVKRRKVDDNESTEEKEEENNSNKLSVLEREEEELLSQYYASMRSHMASSSSSSSLNSLVADHSQGIAYLDEMLDDLMRILLDDYLGEVGAQKETIELMSKMVEVKRNRSLQGFELLARHCTATLVLQRFIQQLTWVLTPPAAFASLNNNSNQGGNASSKIDLSALHGAARVKALLLVELQQKYLVSDHKSALADLHFVRKVKTLSLHVARHLLNNITLNMEDCFTQIVQLLKRHNMIREEKIMAFEAKDGNRRIRLSYHYGNQHTTTTTTTTANSDGHVRSFTSNKEFHKTRKEQLDAQFLIAPAPERVDVNFNASTILATQQKQKLKMYKGRYGKFINEAAKSFANDDPTTAIVLDALDEFVLRCLHGLLRNINNISQKRGKEVNQSATTIALKLELLRREQSRHAQEETEENEESQQQQEELEEEEEKENEVINEEKTENKGDDSSNREAPKSQITSQLHNLRGLSLWFVREHQSLLQSFVFVLIETLHGEGSDEVVASSLDCLLVLMSLRPALSFAFASSSTHNNNATSSSSAFGQGGIDGVNSEDTRHVQGNLFRIVCAYLIRGGVIKRKALHVLAALVSHQQFNLGNSEAQFLITEVIRPEVVERSEFTASALKLMYNIMGKHIHLVCIYNLIDLITELLVHLSAKTVIKKYCTLILVRFLTEYKLTMEKFRSHIDLFCKNLDYPEVGGRLALLELLDALIMQLPLIILRSEAHFLLVPLSVVLDNDAEHGVCKAKAGSVLQHLTAAVGLPVIQPVLEGWLATSTLLQKGKSAKVQKDLSENDMNENRIINSVSTRQMAMHVVAVILPSVISLYKIDAEETTNVENNSNSNSNSNSNDNDTDTKEDYEQEEELQERVNNSLIDNAMNEKQELLQSIAFLLPSVLDGCCYDQRSKKIKNKYNTYNSMSSTTKRKVERHHWQYIYFSLRVMETMLRALPDLLYSNHTISRLLLPHIATRLINHTHPWIQATSLRILRHYCYSFVELECHYLQSEWPDVELAAEHVNNNDADDSASNENKYDVSSQLFIVQLPILHTSKTHYSKSTLNDDNVKATEKSKKRKGSDKHDGVVHHTREQSLLRCKHVVVEVMRSFMSTLQSLFTFTERSDVSDEVHNASSALKYSARSESLKIMVYCYNALVKLSLYLLSADRNIMQVAQANNTDKNNKNKNEKKKNEIISSEETICKSLRKDNVQSNIQEQFTSLGHRMQAIIEPMVQQDSVQNYVVRSATMVQFSAAILSLLPLPSLEHNEESMVSQEKTEESDKDEEQVVLSIITSNTNNKGSNGGNKQVTNMSQEMYLSWLVNDAMSLLPTLHNLIIPLLRCCLLTNTSSTLLHKYGYKAVNAIIAALEERQVLFIDTELPQMKTKQITTRKRQRSVSMELSKKTFLQSKVASIDDNYEQNGEVTLNSVLRELRTLLATLHLEKRSSQIAKDTNHNLKRNRVEMARQSVVHKHKKRKI